MSTDNQIESPHWSGFSRLHKIVAIILAIILLLLWLIGYGPGGSKCASSTVAVADCASNHHHGLQSDAGNNSADVRDSSFLNYDVPKYQLVDNIDTSRVYFDLGSYAMPESTAYDLSMVYANLAKDPTAVAVVSGYHDPSGDLLTNQELAKNRAVSVRDTLIAQGVTAERVVLEKPFQSEGSGPAAQARRVEVRIARLL